MATLSKITSDAFAWRLLTETSRLALTVGVQIILARMLPVEAFGVLAIAMVVISLGSKVSEMGTAPALIQREEITTTHIRVAFSLSVLTGVVLSGAVWFGAPLLAAAFKAPSVTPILQLVGLVFVLGNVGTTAEALLQRAMDYRRLLKVEVISYAVGFALIGITTAMLGYGVWALAWATLAQAATKSLLLVVMRPHPMRLCFAATESRQLLDFGVGMSLSRLAGFAAQNADYFVVGRWLGAAALGLYSRAYQVMCVPINQFSSILNVVLFPAYSTIQSDNSRLRRGYLASLSISAMVVFPALATLAIAAPEVMVGVFGPQWSGAITPFRLLCVGGAGYCIANLADSLVRAKGAVYLKFFYHSVYAACVLAAALIGRRWGISGVAAGVVIAMAVVYVLMAHLSLRLIACSWRRFFFAQWPAVVVSCAAVAAAGPAVGILRFADLPPLVVLAGTGIAAVAASLAAALWLPERWLLPTVVSLIDVVRRVIHDPLGWALAQPPSERVRARSHGLPRLVDIVVALLLLIVAAPILGIVALAVAATSRGPILFRHRRMGRDGRPFEMLKFRTMDTAAPGPQVTATGDPRVTPVGRFLRRTKLDELPELWNVLRGDMALVGPRPEALPYVAVGDPLWRSVLSVRPGLTDEVTVRLRNEEELLAAAGLDHETYYRQYLLPYKLRASAEYLATRTWTRDVAVLWHTVVAVVAPSRIVPPSPSEIIAKDTP